MVRARSPALEPADRVVLDASRDDAHAQDCSLSSSSRFSLGVSGLVRQGARLLRLQMPAAATAINFKRLLNATKPRPAARAAIRRRRPRRSSR
jgi:hypothetical protein